MPTRETAVAKTNRAEKQREDQCRCGGWRGSAWTERVGIWIKKKFLTVDEARTLQLQSSSDTSIPCLPSVHTHSLGDNFVVVVVKSVGFFFFFFVTRHRRRQTRERGREGGGGRGGGGRQTDTQRQKR